MTIPYKYVCDLCGADDTAHTEGFIDWDVPSQSWVFLEHIDCPIFCSCGGEDCFTETPVTDLKIVASQIIKEHTV